MIEDSRPAYILDPVSFTTRDGHRVTLRPAVPDDAPALVAEGRRVAEEGIYVLFEQVWDEAEHRAYIERADPSFQFYWVAEVDGRPVGIVDNARGQLKKTAHVGHLGIWIGPDHRGLGIGRRLMEKAIEWSRALGLDKISLEVFSTNKRAIALYRKLGFEMEARCRHQFKMPDGRYADACFMALWLKPTR